MRAWILGAADPEMAAVEEALRAAGEIVRYATIAGRRPRPDEAYTCALDATAAAVALAGHPLYLVECIAVPLWAGHTPALRQAIVRIDHHSLGDPGYGRRPADYLAASSLGQVLAVLGVAPTHEHRLIAAADHCLTHAYRGACPGVDPDELMRWRAASRAFFQRRSVVAVLDDIAAARGALRSAPDVQLYDAIVARDMRGRHVLELPEAAAREGMCFVADGLPGRDGRRKVVCQVGTPEQIRAFVSYFAPALGLSDIYGDPERGFAGGYAPTANPDDEVQL